VTISGTLVYVKGRGFFRQEWPKTAAGYRTLTLPGFAVDILRRRQVTAGGNPPEALFCSRRGSWLSPHNVRRQWRQAREATSLEWVTPHTFRKTVATLIEREADLKTAAAQLGHASEAVTNQFYIDRPKRAPDSSHLIESLSAAAGRRRQPGRLEHQCQPEMSAMRLANSGAPARPSRVSKLSRSMGGRR
jgi:integrase